MHAAKGGEKRILERNYRITGNIKGKEVVIVDDVLTTGQSVADYKEAIERCGGRLLRKDRHGAVAVFRETLCLERFPGRADRPEIEIIARLTPPRTRAA